MRPIDANALEKEVYEDLHYHAKIENEEFDLITNYLDAAPTIDPESLRPQAEWIWKRRHHGGFHKYTGVDEFGNEHTIMVDERYESDEPYCPNCGKWNESIWLNYCPNCGAKMKGAGEYVSD